MKTRHERGGNFEEKLLDELRGLVARQGAEEEDSAAMPSRSSPRRRAPRLALGAAAVIAAAAAALVFSSGGKDTPRAFAVEPQDGGGVTIKVYSPEDAAGLEAALAEFGIRSQVTWLPAGMACREPHFTESSVKNAMGGTNGGMSMAGPGPAMTIGVMTAAQYRELGREYRSGELSEGEFHESTGNINLDPTQFRPDQSVVISGTRGPSPDLDVVVNGAKGPFTVNPEGGTETHFAVAEGAVEPCEPVAVPADQSMLRKMDEALEAEPAR